MRRRSAAAASRPRRCGRSRAPAPSVRSPPAGRRDARWTSSRPVERARRRTRVGVDLVVEPVEIAVRRRRPDMVGHGLRHGAEQTVRWRAARSSARFCAEMSSTAPTKRMGALPWPWWRRRHGRWRRSSARCRPRRPIVRYSTWKGARSAGSSARWTAWSVWARSSGCSAGQEHVVVDRRIGRQAEQGAAAVVPQQAPVRGRSRRCPAGRRRRPAAGARRFPRAPPRRARARYAPTSVR